MDGYLKDKGFVPGPPSRQDVRTDYLIPILQMLDQAIGNGQQARDPSPLVAKPGWAGRGYGQPVGELVDYMNYDGDPNMGLLKGLFGGRAQPGTPSWKFEEGLGRRRRGK